jgi:hypothetical protein
VKTPLDRFIGKVDKNGPIPECAPDLGPCWLWTGSVMPRGYGKVTIAKRRLLAHRIAYEAFVGPIPEGLTLDHLCRVRRCVNPGHLEPVTVRENTLRSPVAPAAINARKTHCVHGHEFSPENTRVQFRRSDQGEHRICRACARARYHERRAA